MYIYITSSFFDCRCRLLVESEFILSCIEELMAVDELIEDDIFKDRRALSGELLFDIIDIIILLLNKGYSYEMPLKLKVTGKYDSNNNSNNNNNNTNTEVN